jgi:VWFA-related protein
MNWQFVRSRAKAGRLGMLIAWVVLATTIASGPRPGAAQSSPTDKAEGKQKSQADTSTFIEREEVRFVTLDLIVEERGGAGGSGWHLARELTKEQIRVLVGGQEMALDLFENWCAGVPPGQPPSTIASATSAGSSSVATAPTTSATAESEADSSPPDSSATVGKPSQDAKSAAAAGDSTGPARPSSGSPSTRKYILYFDLQHLTLGGRNRSFRSAIDWAGKTAKAVDEAMIVTGGLSLRVVRPMSPVGGNLQADIQRAMEDFTADDLWAEGEENREYEVRRMLRWDAKAAEALAKGYTAMDQDITRRSLENMHDLMALFGTIQGTKNLVFFAETVRLVPGTEYLAQITDTTSFTGGFTPDGISGVFNDVSHELDQLVEAANERNVRIYTVQPAGLNEKTDIEGALTMLATETGGRHVERTNQIGLILDRVAEDLACFYRIGFRMSPRHTGSTQRILVRIGNSDTRYRARYRRTLTDPTREQQEEETLLAAYLAPAAARAFPVSVRARRLFDHPGGTRFRIEVSVPLEGLLAGPSPSAAGGVVSLKIGGQVVPLRAHAARGASAQQDPWSDVDPKKKTFGFDRHAEIRLPTPRGSPRSPTRAIYVNEFDAPPGEYRVVAVAEDGLTRSVSTALADLTARTSPAVLGDPLIGFLDLGALLIGSGAPKTSEEWAGGNLESISPAKASIPAKLSVAGQGEPVLQDSVTLLYPVCPTPGHVAKSRDAGGGGEGALPWKIRRDLTCGEASAQLPPLTLPEILHGTGCILVADPLPPERLHPGPCRMEVTLEGPGAPQEIRIAQFQVQTAAPPAGKTPE